MYVLQSKCKQILQYFESQQKMGFTEPVYLNLAKLSVPKNTTENTSTNPPSSSSPSAKEEGQTKKTSETSTTAFDIPKIKTDLNIAINDMTALIREFGTVLGNHHDLRSMHLTDRKNARLLEEFSTGSNEWPVATPFKYEDNTALGGWDSTSPDSRRYDQIELIMENYLWQFEEIQHRMRLLLDEVETHEKTSNYALNRNRNEIMRVTAKLTVLTMGFSYCALVTSMFGMNLDSHLEHNPYAFWTIASAMGALVPIAIYKWFKYRLKKKNIWL
ncbi:putative magnesium transporter, CorA-like protein [Reticulomyxa filosa]|uniref:Putative magnesium transporter, CorA-like protein n=1 Tax=Reticulomyxa filosa TaxID=46433 RepID=X6NI46_RETFI|nr:putative magnesium transporter, CorA-like protein [Reticulomyxa filosa]|eukprot:ETO25990.1 putative magnesium transporter, CorA-like protein [Reticulomyxa filosa]